MTLSPSPRVRELAEDLALSWELSALEYREVLSWGVLMELAENDWQDTFAHMAMRAELMAIAGSEHDKGAPRETELLYDTVDGRWRA